MTIKEAYKRAYKLYLDAVRGMEKRHGVDIERRSRVKKPTRGSLRALERERERLRQHRWKETEIIAEPEPIPPTPPEDPEDIRASVELEEIMDMISEGTTYSGLRIDSDVMIKNASDILEEIFKGAKERLTDREIMDRLKSNFGNMERILNMIQQIVYAVYNSRNVKIKEVAVSESTYAKWFGRGARDRWQDAIDDIAEALI